MPSRDDAANMSIVDTLSAEAYTGTENGAVVDLRGCDSATIVIETGDTVTGTFTWKIQHGDESDGSDMATITPVQSPAVDSILLGLDYANMAVNEIKRYAYVGTKRYVRVIIDAAGTTADFHAFVVKTRLDNPPDLTGFTESL